VTLLTGTSGSGWSRRGLLRIGSLLMIATGLIFATTSVFVVLLVVGVIGTMNPSGGDVSVFRPLEHSVLPRTTSAEDRSHLFAQYTFGGVFAGALGAAASGLPERWHWPAGTVFWVYGAAGMITLALYASLSPACDPPAHEAPTPLGPSRAVVYRLATLFTLDAAGGGFVVQSLLALWLFRRFDFTLAKAGVVFAGMGVLSALSGFVAVRIETRLGPIRTMVFTHLPAQVFLILAALMPNGGLAVACLLARSLLSSMDVPVRDAYVMTVVTPAERAAAASVTNVPRSLAAALPPFLAGWMLDHSTFGWPLIAGGVCKATYDLLLLREVDG
jgi:predicted MFS family arabinose efflux permease